MTGPWHRWRNPSGETSGEIAEIATRPRSMILTSATAGGPAGTSRSATLRWPTASSTGWCTTLIGSKCAANRCAKNGRERREMNAVGRPTAVEKPGQNRPWKSQERFPLPTAPATTTFSLTDPDHFLQNPTASVASLRRLITSIRNAESPSSPEPRSPSSESPQYVSGKKGDSPRNDLAA